MTSSGHEQHGGILPASVAVDEVRRVVSQDEQRPSRGDRAGGVAKRPGTTPRAAAGGRARSPGECCRLGLVLEDVRDDPVDLDAAALGEARALPERDVGEVDRRHRPAALREPDGVPPLTAGEVERPPGLEPADLGGEEPVRLGRPEELLPGVARVPVLPGEAGADGRRRSSRSGHLVNLPALLASRPNPGRERRTVAAEYRLLGPFEVLVDGRPVTLAGPPQRAMLVCPCAHPRRRDRGSVLDARGRRPPSRRARTSRTIS